VIYNKINQGAILTSAELSEHAIALPDAPQPDALPIELHERGRYDHPINARA
jgi:hypothetical protein